MVNQPGLKGFRIKGFIGLIALSVLFYSHASAVTESRYFRSDQHTVSGKTAYQLGTSNSNDKLWYGAEKFFYNLSLVSYVSWVYIQHEDGTNTVIGKGVAFTARDSPGDGYQSADWNCPETPLRPTDAVYIHDYIWDVFSSNILAERYFITERLGATKLNAATWIFTRWTSRQRLGDNTRCETYHGNSDYNTRIDGFSWEQIPKPPPPPPPPPPAPPTPTSVDISLNVYDGAGKVRIACQPAGTLSSPLRIRKSGTTYGIVLVDISDPQASRIRIRTSSGVKALRKY